MKKQLHYFLLLAVLLTGCAERKKPPVDELIVVKSQRQMYLVHEGTVFKTYNIGLGQNPEGHKGQQGDSRTPEGEYKIEGRNPNSQYYLSLRISYPDENDIDHAQEWGVDPGDHIMIHGMRGAGSRRDFLMAGDWTQGCIAVTNEEMHELWHLIEEGTPITIYP